MNLKDIERAVATLESHIFKNSNAYSAGVLKTHFKGSGLQFKEHQIYSLGDDVRFIDWKLSARTNNIYVKTFEEDRNVEITVMIDVIPTMFYGSMNTPKLQMAFELTALLYLISKQTGDKVRVILMSENKIELPPKSGEEGLIQFISVLEDLELLLPDGKVNVAKWKSKSSLSLKDKLKILKGQLAKRKEVVYLSDFYDYRNVEEFRRLRMDKRFHGIKLISPLDEEKLKFSFPIPMGWGGRFSGLQSPPKETDEKKGHWLKLSTSERYLEKFVREMI